MKALTYIEHGKFALLDKPKPEILDPCGAIIRVTLGSICTSELHIKHGSVPGITVGRELVGIVESVGSAVTFKTGGVDGAHPRPMGHWILKNAWRKAFRGLSQGEERIEKGAVEYGD